jgi:hypothetical protein
MKTEMLPRWAVWPAVLAITLVLGWIDWATGHELNFFVFYFLPVGLAGWYLGLNASVFMAVTCALVWFGADALFSFLRGLEHNDPALLFPRHRMVGTENSCPAHCGEGEIGSLAPLTLGNQSPPGAPSHLRPLQEDPRCGGNLAASGGIHRRALRRPVLSWLLSRVRAKGPGGGRDHKSDEQIRGWRASALTVANPEREGQEKSDEQIIDGAAPV